MIYLRLIFCQHSLDIFIFQNWIQSLIQNTVNIICRPFCEYLHSFFIEMVIAGASNGITIPTVSIFSIRFNDPPIIRSCAGVGNQTRCTGNDIAIFVLCAEIFLRLDNIKDSSTSPVANTQNKEMGKAKCLEMLPKNLHLQLILDVRTAITLALQPYKALVVYTSVGSTGCVILQHGSILCIKGIACPCKVSSRKKLIGFVVFCVICSN